MNKFNNKAVSDLFNSYPVNARKKLMDLRALIYEVAAQDPKLGELQECLKWGEPAYTVKGGSTVRINWKPSSPEQFFVYFNCKTTLIETFKEVYGDTFSYEGSRAIVFNVFDEIPLAPLKHCITLSLNYHHVKHLPLLGI